MPLWAGVCTATCTKVPKVPKGALAGAEAAQVGPGWGSERGVDKTGFPRSEGAKKYQTNAARRPHPGQTAPQTLFLWITLLTSCAQGGYRAKKALAGQHQGLPAQQQKTLINQFLF